MTDNRKHILMAFFIGIGIFLISVVPFAAQNGMIFYFYGDFNTQQIPFTVYLQQQMRGISLPQFDFAAGTGLDFMEAYGFYNLFSPFMIPLMLVPTELVIYAMPFVIALKFGLCSVFAYVYAARFCRNKDYAVAAAMLYTFSGYQMANFIFHYLDALVFFPLLLTALEMAVVEKKRGFFGVTAAVCAFTNYYIFGTEVIFLVLYFIFRLSDKSFRISVKDFLCLAAESLLAVLAAGIVLLPALSALMNNPRYGDGFGGIGDLLVYETPWRYARILQAIFLPPDVQGYTNFFPDYEGAYPCGSRWSSQALYLPLFGMSGVIAYMAAEKKSWMTKITAACLVIAFIPFFNSLFSFGSSVYYARWMFAPTLIMAVMTASALENEPKYFRAGFIINGAVIVGTAVFALISPMEKLSAWEGSVYYSTAQRIIQIVFGVAGLVVGAILLFKAARDNSYGQKIIVAVTAFSFVFMEITTLFGMGETAEPYVVTSVYTNYPEIEKTEYGSRVSGDSYFDNGNMYNGYYSVYTFNSTVNPCFQDYCNALEISPVEVTENYGAECLCSVKTKLVSGYYDETTPPPGVTGDYGYLRNESYCTLYENRNFIPMAFCYDYYITEEKLMSLDKEIRGEVMLRGMVVDEASAEGYLTAADDSMLRDMSDEEFSRECALRAETAARTFTSDGDSCRAEITAETPELVFFSIAYDEDFTAYVDGAETDIVRANVGFMAVPVDAGTHTVELVYHSSVRDYGFGATLCGIGGFAVYIAAILIVERKRRTAQN